MRSKYYYLQIIYDAKFAINYTGVIGHASVLCVSMNLCTALSMCMLRAKLKMNKKYKKRSSLSYLNAYRAENNFQEKNCQYLF